MYPPGFRLHFSECLLFSAYCGDAQEDYENQEIKKSIELGYLTMESMAGIRGGRPDCILFKRMRTV